MEYAKQLSSFVRTLDSKVEQFMDNRVDSEVIFKLGDMELPIPMNADTFCRLVEFAKQELKESRDLEVVYNRIRPLAEWQDNNIDRMDDFIIVEAMCTSIHNPFLSTCMRFNVDPLDEYGEAFLRSDWFNEDKLKALEAIVNAS